MFGFTYKIFTGLLSICTMQRFSESLAFNSRGHIKCVSFSNRSYRVRQTLVDKNYNETLFYPFTVCVNKFDECCSTINDPYA